MLPMQNTNQEEKPEWFKINHLSDSRRKQNTQKKPYFYMS